MIKTYDLANKPSDEDCEKASNSYLMSLVALVAGLPLPIINLIATWAFYLGNRRASIYVKWHCTQALISQFILLIMNSVSMTWTLSILFGDNHVNNLYISYIITVVSFNLVEFVVTIYTAIQVRKGRQVEWFFYGSLTNDLLYDKK